MNLVAPVCFAMRIVCDASDIFQSLQTSSQQGDDTPSSLKAANIGTRILILCLNTTELGCTACNSSEKTLTTIKVAEMASRTVDVSLSTITAIFQAGVNDSPLKALQTMLIPMAGLLRSGCEMQALTEEAFLKLSDEELAKAKRPVYEEDYNHNFKLVGFKEVTREECQQILGNARRFSIASNVVEAAVKSGAISSVPSGISAAARGVGQLYNRLAAALQARQAAEDIDPFYLRGLATIPEALHDDPVFNRYTCAITHAPCRFPVGDPNGITLYERAAIQTWLNNFPRSPMTQQPLRAHQLVPKPAIQALIDHRLQYHEDRLRLHVQLGFGEPANPAIQQAANIEAPNL
jgi:hypothetical protein